MALSTSAIVFWRKLPPATPARVRCNLHFSPSGPCYPPRDPLRAARQHRAMQRAEVKYPNRETLKKTRLAATPCILVLLSGLASAQGRTDKLNQQLIHAAGEGNAKVVKTLLAQGGRCRRARRQRPNAAQGRHRARPARCHARPVGEGCQCGGEVQLQRHASQLGPWVATRPFPEASMPTGSPSSSYCWTRRADIAAKTSSGRYAPSAGCVEIQNDGHPAGASKQGAPTSRRRTKQA